MWEQYYWAHAPAIHKMSVSQSNQPSYSSWCSVSTLAGKWLKCNHSNTLCNCQSAPVGIESIKSVIEQPAVDPSAEAWLCNCSLYLNQCLFGVLCKSSKWGLGSPLSSWKRGDKMSVVSFREPLYAHMNNKRKMKKKSFREHLSQLLYPSNFCKSFKVLKLCFLISMFWGWLNVHW
jgi:hypothetical protein